MAAPLVKYVTATRTGGLGENMYHVLAEAWLGFADSEPWLWGRELQRLRPIGGYETPESVIAWSGIESRGFVGM